jgi:hypothetical protein
VIDLERQVFERLHLEDALQIKLVRAERILLEPARTPAAIGAEPRGQDFLRGRAGQQALEGAVAATMLARVQHIQSG